MKGIISAPMKWVKGKIDELKGLIETIVARLGNSDISEIGDGTVTGAVSELNGALVDISDVSKSVVKLCDSVTATTTALSDSILNYKQVYIKTLAGGSGGEYGGFTIPTPTITLGSRYEVPLTFYASRYVNITFPSNTSIVLNGSNAAEIVGVWGIK